ncbi:3-phosphoserine/phosphohydroxythreonine transaminase [Pueribacillus theae]|uniref:Phosphoserine aminotransferase n=1 Tax=Pueribacillus theae TaxID=2171751 RepID=A0A2U1K309_9BACI|nr:3-phosphoserine/phosphohydroxythreonine transaminase [Pueribacillus theae]PWA11802.1 3-phosphoserine/phosphohydroxythreonine transaminase [Pueribacillus theae]
MERSYNFNAGPAALPLDVLKKAQSELTNFKNSGMSVMELSHRSKEYEEVHNRAQQLLRELLNIPENYEVLFLQGGASLQFTMVPINFLGNGNGSYVLTGSWSKKALKEAEKIGKTTIAATSEQTNFDRIPKLNELSIDDNASYVHITSNNTIYGTQWQAFPTVENLIADMSSDILCRPLDVSKFKLIYAGAQKNLGPSGVTVVIADKNFLEKGADNLPTMLDYRTHSKNNSLFNTPPTFAIYMLSLVLEWLKDQGGTEKIQETNNQKASLLYNVIDESNGFYNGHAQKDSRSIMNVTFTLPSDDLTKQFLAESKELGFVGLNGHRSIGGCRASIYNAVPLESVEKLSEFMISFQKKA